MIPSGMKTSSKLSWKLLFLRIYKQSDFVTKTEIHLSCRQWFKYLYAPFNGAQKNFLSSVHLCACMHAHIHYINYIIFCISVSGFSTIRFDLNVKFSKQENSEINLPEGRIMGKVMSYIFPDQELIFYVVLWVFLLPMALRLAIIMVRLAWLRLSSLAKANFFSSAFHEKTLLNYK